MQICELMDIANILPFFTLTNFQLTEEYQLPRIKFTELIETRNLLPCLDKRLSKEVTKSLICK